MRFQPVTILAGILTTSTVFAYPHTNSNSALTARQLEDQVNLVAREHGKTISERTTPLPNNYPVSSMGLSNQHTRISNTHNANADQHDQLGQPAAAAAHRTAADLHAQAATMQANAHAQNTADSHINAGKASMDAYTASFHAASLSGQGNIHHRRATHDLAHDTDTTTLITRSPTNYLDKARKHMDKSNKHSSVADMHAQLGEHEAADAHRTASNLHYDASGKNADAHDQRASDSAAKAQQASAAAAAASTHANSMSNGIHRRRATTDATDNSLGARTVKAQ